MMFTMFEWFQSLDAATLESERFGISAEDAKKLPEKYAEAYLPPARFQPYFLFLSKSEKQKMLHNRITSGLGLDLAQNRAVQKWLEGIGL